MVKILQANSILIDNLLNESVVKNSKFTYLERNNLIYKEEIITFLINHDSC